MEKVFGIGFSKTGTTTLEAVFDILGYNVCKGHWNLKHNDYLLSLYVNKAYDEIYNMTKYWDAYADGPWGGGELYKKLAEWYPKAKFILTIRDSNEWYNSLYNLLTRYDSNEEKSLIAYHKNERYGSTYFFKHIFNINDLENNKEKIIRYYEKTNNEIIEYFKDNPNFISLNLTNDTFYDKWEIICEFLEKPIPKAHFPHANKGVYENLEICKKKFKKPLKDRIRDKTIYFLNKI